MDAQLRVVEPLGDRRRLGGRGAVVEVPRGLRGQGAGGRGRPGPRELERQLDLGADPLDRRRPGPHPGAHERLDRELADDLGPRLRPVPARRRFPSRSRSPPVDLQRLRPRHRAAEAAPRGVVGLELQSAAQEDERLINLVAGDRQLGRSAQLGQRPLAPRVELRALTGPRDVGVVGSNRVVVVVDKQGGVLIARARSGLEPARGRAVSRLRDLVLRPAAGPPRGTRLAGQTGGAGRDRQGNDRDQDRRPDRVRRQRARVGRRRVPPRRGCSRRGADSCSASVAAGGACLRLGNTPLNPDVLEQLRKLGDLRKAGVLTDAEFEAKKAELLGRL